jgi:hypothetical protein
MLTVLSRADVCNVGDPTGVHPRNGAKVAGQVVRHGRRALLGHPLSQSATASRINSWLYPAHQDDIPIVSWLPSSNGLVTASTKDELERLEAERARLHNRTPSPRKSWYARCRVLGIPGNTWRKLAQISRGDVERARRAVRNLTDSAVRTIPELYELVAELRGDYAGMLKLATATGDYKQQGKQQYI